MFRTGQMFTATELVRNFSRITTLLMFNPQPIVVTSRKGARFVFMNAELFEPLWIKYVEGDARSLEVKSLREEIVGDTIQFTEVG